MRPLIHFSLLLRLILVGSFVLVLNLSPRPRLLQASLDGAYQALQGGVPAQAARRLSVVLAYEPWRADLQLAAGRYAAQGDDPLAAVGFLEPLSQAEEFSAQDWLTLGDAYRAIEDENRAVFAWQKASEMGADRLAITRRLLAVHQAQADAQAVIQDWKTLADLQPADFQAQVEAGLRLSAADPQTALPYLERAGLLDRDFALQVRPLRDAILTASLAGEPSFILVAAGRQLAALEKWDLASQAFQNAVQLRPDFGEAWAFLAESLQRQGAMGSAQAKRTLDQALKLNPDSALVHIIASIYWQRQGDEDQAQEHLSQGLALEPENPVLFIEMGNLLARNGDLQEARQAFQKAVEIDPQNISYRRVLVDFLLHHQVELHESALAIARQAVIIAPNDPAALDLLGETLFLLGDYHTAGRFLARALQLNPRYAPALMHFGVVSIYLGDSSKARQLLTQARHQAEDPVTLAQVQRLLEYYFP